ncbi:MAG: class I SAM-dependent methyltransferase [bacterium]|nr:class I SAM-dependent methyltransferase [bacterium]
MLSALTCCLPALWALAQVEPKPADQDPEQTPQGRKQYLGRRIAHTMHWRGAAWLMRKTREDEENGALLREWLAVAKGQAVCDLGCGNGYHTLPLAEAVGAKGVVHAVDLQPQMLTMLRVRAEKRRLENLRFVEATVDDPKLANASCDLVLMVDVYHELSHPVRVMRHVRRALRPGGRVVLVEFRAEDPEVPIKPEHMMSKAQVIREMASHGFEFVGETDALPWQHAMAFRPQQEVDRWIGPRQVTRGFLRALGGKDWRIVRPFLAARLATTNRKEFPRLPKSAGFEIRGGDGATVTAVLAGHAIELRADANGRWLISAVRTRK